MIIQLGLSVYESLYKPLDEVITAICQPAVGLAVENHEPQGNCFRLTT